MTEASNRVAQWVSSAGAVRIGLVLAGIVVVAVVLSVDPVLRRKSTRV